MADLSRFQSEEQLQLALESWFGGLGIPFESHPELTNGCIPDIGLYLPDGSTPWGVLELKNGLTPETFSVKDAADYFEQCLKYQDHLQLPVFLGPFFIPTMGTARYFGGGCTPEFVTSMFSAMAGRMNIGLMFINAEPGYEADLSFWYGFRFTLRQQIVADWHKTDTKLHDEWPSSPLSLVARHGAASKKVRS